LFLVNILTNPVVIQSTDPEGPYFPAITVEVRDASIEEIMTLSDNTTVFPNPTENVFTVKYKNIIMENDVNIVLYDINGKKIREINLGKQSPGWYHYEVNVDDLKDGLYMLQLTMNNFISHTEKILISR